MFKFGKQPLPKWKQSRAGNIRLDSAPQPEPEVPVVTPLSGIDAGDVIAAQRREADKRNQALRREAATRQGRADAVREERIAERSNFQKWVDKPISI